MEWKIIFFISEIPDKNKFTVQDAIVGELPVIEEDSVKSEQFQIFNFLSNVRLPKFPDILNNMIRPQPGPSDNQRPPPLQRPPPQFIPSPQNNLNNPNHKIPNHQHQSSQSQAANEALTVFNQGLDNFIQNPASLAHVSRPVNGWGEHILLCLFYIHLHIWETIMLPLFSPLAWVWRTRHSSCWIWIKIIKLLSPCLTWMQVKHCEQLWYN